MQYLASRLAPNYKGIGISIGLNVQREKYKKTKLPSKKFEKGFLFNFQHAACMSVLHRCRTLILERSAHPVNKTLPPDGYG